MRDLLKFLTCGSVDDGKSTLLGHLLYDAKLLFADQEDALLLDSKVGSTDGKIDYSLLLDGLAAEREQGITIDVAYRYFTTDKRSFIAADCPGHEEYTRNMAVGAGFADVAVILIDATKGVLIQTKRHTRICALMGIKHFVYAVNKMDLTGYSQEAFEQVKVQIDELLAEFDVHSVQVIPVSATEGDNVVVASGAMGFYNGPTLKEYLEDIEVGSSKLSCGFSMPVQRVCRPNREFRGFEGTVATGTVSVGDSIQVKPGTTKSKVARIVRGFDDVQSASAGQAVTLTLEDEVDVSRGSVLVDDFEPMVGNMMEVELLWMDDVPLREGASFVFCVGTESVVGTVSAVKSRIDVNTGAVVEASNIAKNEIALADVNLSKKVAFDSFQSNAALGRMILIDRVTNMTSACAVVRRKIEHADNLTWQDADITRQIRESHMQQRALTLWFTGLSGAGKSTVANELERRLHAQGRYTMLLDGDNVRMGLNRDLGFAEQDRVENIRRVAEVAKLMNDAGLVTLVSFISPFAADRRSAREIIGDDSFVEVYVSTPIEECERRDVKGLYKKARSGQIKNFTGVDSAYEVPQNPQITIDTSVEDLDASVERIIAYIESLQG